MVELLCLKAQWCLGCVREHAGKVGKSIGGGLARTGRNEDSTRVCRSDFNAIAAAAHTIEVTVTSKDASLKNAPVPHLHWLQALRASTAPTLSSPFLNTTSSCKTPAFSVHPPPSPSRHPKQCPPLSPSHSPRTDTSFTLLLSPLAFHRTKLFNFYIGNQT
jgi:hypothetical protein